MTRVRIQVVQAESRLLLVGEVNGRKYPPVTMPCGMSMGEAEFEGIRRFLARHQDDAEIVFHVGRYVKDVVSYKTLAVSKQVQTAVNRVDYLIRRRPGPVAFEVLP